MKKYLLGVFAIALALGFSAFTMPRFTTYTFQYTGPTTYGSGDIAAPSNWTLGDACEDDFSADDKPCSFTVSSAVTNYADVNGHPISTLTLQPTLGGVSGKYILLNVKENNVAIQDEIVNLDIP